MSLRLLRTLQRFWLHSFRRRERRNQAPLLPPFPTFNSGGALVDIADRNALYDLLDADEGS
jgi:hypothetical protein